MKEISGDIWDYHERGHWIIITTNGTVRDDGKAVMGSGVALQAKQKFPGLPSSLGRLVKERGNHPHYFPVSKLFTFPVKHNWWEKADIDLIELSAARLDNLIAILEADAIMPITPPYYMVRPGCGSGWLDWKDVKPILEKYLDDRFVVVEKE